MPGYERLYRGTYAPYEYTMKILNLVENACQRHNLPLAGAIMEIKSVRPKASYSRSLDLRGNAL